MELTQDKKLTAEQLALFYAKDIITHRKLDAHSPETYKQLASNPPSNEEIRAIMKNRLAKSHFNRASLFNFGDS